MGHNLCLDSKGRFWLYNTVADGFSAGGDFLPGIEMSYLALNPQSNLDNFRWLLNHINGKGTPYSELRITTIHVRCKNLIHSIIVPAHIVDNYKTRGKTICWMSGLFSSKDNAEHAINANLEKCKDQMLMLESRVESINQDLFWAWIRW